MEMGYRAQNIGPSRLSRGILKNWIMRLRSLAHPKSVGQANRGRLVLQFESKGSLEAESPLSWRRSIFFLLRPSVGLIGPTHVMEGDLLFPKSTDLNINLI